MISSKTDIKKYQEKFQRTFFEKLFDFVLGREKKPADDAILRRGLHDSWEKKWEGFWIKRGFSGKEAKKAYSNVNQSRKMQVVDFKTKQLAPDVDGHAKAVYLYTGPKNDQWYNPIKDKLMGLVHRIKGTRAIRPREAGEVARRSILKMTEKMVYHNGQGNPAGRAPV